MKFCVYCQAQKPFFPQERKSSKASGFFGARCWDCVCAAGSPWRGKTVQEYRSKPEVQAKVRETSAAWSKNNRGLQNAHTTAYNQRKQRQMPSWADPDIIKIYYIYAEALGLSVDHIVPLNGKLVCGLHTQDNLQLLTHAENSAKGNRYVCQ